MSAGLRAVRYAEALAELDGGVRRIGRAESKPWPL